jgi:hypothetical protein
MISQREDSNGYMVDFFDYEDWNGFEEIFSKLKERFGAEIQEQIDGPESRVWHIEIEGIPLSLHNNPY